MLRELAAIPIFYCLVGVYMVVLAVGTVYEWIKEVIAR
jgi:hypothetical protein